MRDGSPISLRFKLSGIFFALLGLLVVGRYAGLMVFEGGMGMEAGISMPAIERGPILDRNGRILAIQTRLDSVTAWTPLVRDAEKTAELLGSALDMDPGSILRRLQSSPGFVFIKRKITPTESSRVRSLIDSGLLRGITLRPESGRNYPERNTAAHVIGYVGIDNIGLHGLEYTFNHVLSPPVVGGGNETVYGSQVFLTIDLNIQHALDQIARRVSVESRSDSVIILAADARTGDILGYAAQPDYDPNTFASVPPEILRNKPISLLYEPGSVFKVFTLAAGIEHGNVSPADLFNCPGHYEGRLAGGRPFRINCLGTHGPLDIGGILKYSCNTGAALVSERLSDRGLYEALKAFGFGAPTGLPLNGEEEGMLRSPENWSLRSRPTIAIGQEIAVTAMQVVKAATALANEGILLEPHIVQKVVSSDGKLIKEYERTPLRRVLSADTARAILEGMRTATQAGGTATRAAIRGVNVSAKTGTAQMIDPLTGRYSERSFVASALAIFPTEDPRIILYVVIEGPQGDSFFGGRVAAPVVRAAGEFLVSYLGIPGSEKTVVNHEGRVVLPRPLLQKPGESIPDYSGMAKRSLLPLLERRDMRVVMQGSGWVVRQDPPPGTLFREGMTLVLEFE